MIGIVFNKVSFRGFLQFDKLRTIQTAPYENGHTSLGELSGKWEIILSSVTDKSSFFLRSTNVFLRTLVYKSHKVTRGSCQLDNLKPGRLPSIILLLRGHIIKARPLIVRGHGVYHCDLNT